MFLLHPVARLSLTEFSVHPSTAIGIALLAGAYEWRALVPVRKPGKLPRARITESYTLEYGTDTLESHADAIGSGARVLIVDDVLATGGTAAAVVRLVGRAGATLGGIAAVIDLSFLPWRSLDGIRAETLVRF